MFTDYFIKRPIFASVCSIIIAVVGLICMINLPIEQFPPIAPPQISIKSVYIGASSEVVESSVTIPIEQELNGLEGLRYMSSNSDNTGTSEIIITLEPSRNIEDAILEIQNKIKQAEARLPEEVKRSGITIEKSSNSIIMALAFISPKKTYDKFFISDYVERNVSDSLKRVKGVGSVFTFGQRRYAMRVWLDPIKMASRNISSSELISALSEQNI